MNSEALRLLKAAAEARIEGLQQTERNWSDKVYYCQRYLERVQCDLRNTQHALELVARLLQPVEEPPALDLPAELDQAPLALDGRPVERPIDS